MARLVAVFAVWIFLAGCTGGPTPIKGTGEEIGPPQGWTEYCERNPKDPSCISLQEWLKRSLREMQQGIKPARWVP